VSAPKISVPSPGSWLDVVDGISVTTGVEFTIPSDDPPPRESIGATIPHLRMSNWASAGFVAVVQRIASGSVGGTH
jgi:hypothetical protein